MSQKIGSRSAALVLAGLVLLSQQASATAAPMSIAGGDLDPAITISEIYLGTPRSAEAPPGRGCEMARRYVELINRGQYAAVAALYADDATFVEPVRPTLRGRMEIDDFYTRHIGAMKPSIIAVAYLGDDRECMVELAIQVELAGQKRYSLASVDHFILGDDGRIKSMVAFARPR